MDTYTLVVRETSTHEGVDVDVIGEDGLIETTTQLTYSDYNVAPERDDDRPDRIEEEFTVDASSIDLQLERDGRTFAFQAIADGEVAARIEVADSDWDLRD
ncbi:hypothetical protein B4589_015220 [Halolamina sp. CBA1230]|uniref:hypothetical protein n=1 Tax=Halolamina sp. CBA1230 TaxID=1853690 RepID=UPI00117B3D43|nr:hypothetical protein [Halolamina sp. CBA1230]QKY21657.1 hypothetical protein B4589_015220 [Halolamina sp. CBA1230]